jgi:hypothetical protein
VKRLVIALATITALGACTPQEMARHYGGTAKVELEKGQKLVTVTWKEGSNLWYLTRPMREGEVPQTYAFKESSSLGVIEGTIIIVESK